MAAEDRRSIVGEAVERAYVDAVTQWLREHRRGREPELAWSEDVVALTITAELKKSRKASIFVSVIAREPWNSETYPFALERIPGRGFRVKH